MLTFYDKLLISILLSISLLFFIFIKCHSKGNMVYITIDGNEVITADIDVNRRLSIKGAIGITEIEIKDGRVRVIDSPCSNKTCVKTGWIDKPYQTIICIPNHVVIEIANKSKNIDAITR